MVDRNGHPLAIRSTDAKGDERKQVLALINQVSLLSANVWFKGEYMPIVEADKGYDNQWLRQQLLKQGFFPAIPYRQLKNPSETRPKFSQVKAFFNISSRRWVVERTFSWIKRQSRRLLLRWERTQKAWEAVLKMGIIRYWIRNLF